MGLEVRREAVLQRKLIQPLHNQPKVFDYILFLSLAFESIDYKNFCCSALLTVRRGADSNVNPELTFVRSHSFRPKWQCCRLKWFDKQDFLLYLQFHNGIFHKSGNSNYTCEIFANWIRIGVYIVECILSQSRIALI